MDAAELRARARQEADELGPELPGIEAELWREERWGAVVLLAGLADDNVELLDEAARLLGYRRRGQPPRRGRTND